MLPYYHVSCNSSFMEICAHDGCWFNIACILLNPSFFYVGYGSHLTKSFLCFFYMACGADLAGTCFSCLYITCVSILWKPASTVLHFIWLTPLEILFCLLFYFIGFLPRVSPFWTFFNLRGIHISESPFFCFTLHVTCTLQSRSAVFTLCAMDIVEILFQLLIWVELTIEKSCFYCFHIACGLHFAEYYF